MPTMLLNPPYIEGTLPAFYKKKDGTIEIIVPFSLDLSTNKKSIENFYLKVKYIRGSDYLLTLSSKEFDLKTQEVKFSISDEKSLQIFRVGQFYKLQLAYREKGIEDNISLYSTVGVAKFTTYPKIEITNLSMGKVNNHTYFYNGIYSQYTDEPEAIKDMSEKVYSYRFTIKNDKDEFIFDTGDLLHNTEEDSSPYETTDSFFFNQDLDEKAVYKLQYSVTTVNHLHAESPEYLINQVSSTDNNFNADFNISNNFNNGYIDIGFSSIDKKPLNGRFLLSRADPETNYKEWHLVSKFNLYNQLPDIIHIKDFSIAQGVEYKYCVQQYNEQGLYSKRYISESIYADFEDIFLSDENVQLRVRYNPKVSSFKTVYGEGKTVTIGSQFPFFFRNGYTAYKEFPISGLISHLEDEDELFLSKEELGLEELSFVRTETNSRGGSLSASLTSPSSENIFAERTFKLRVLDWLNDGKPKMFRSPAEGNYIVRLMNISLSPNDTVGRMIHSFNASAVEAAPYNYESLLRFHLVKDSESIVENDDKEIPVQVSTIPLSTTDRRFAQTHYTEILEDNGVFYANGNVLTEEDNVKSLSVSGLNGSEVFLIDGSEITLWGANEYNLDAPVNTFGIPSGQKYNGLVTYTHLATIDSPFEDVAATEEVRIVGKQFFGPAQDITAALQDKKMKLDSIYHICFKKKGISTSEEIITPVLFYPISEKVSISGKVRDLFHSVTFIDSTNSQTLPIDNQYRMNENLYVFDKRTFPQMVNDSLIYVYSNSSKEFTLETTPEYSSEKLYFIKENYTLYKTYDSKKSCLLDKEKYNDFVLMFTETKNNADLETFKNSYEPIEYEFEINGEKISLNEQSEYCYYADDFDPSLYKGINISNGIFAEISALGTEITYTCEASGLNAELTDMYINVVKYYKDLSSKEEMTSRCLPIQKDSRAEKDYVMELESARDEYRAIYPQYLTLLETEIRE